MGSLKQYIDLYEQQRQTIEAGSPALFNRLRREALSALHALGSLPGKGDEGYSYVQPEQMFAPDYGLNIARVPFAVDVAATFHCDVPNVSTLLGVVVNDEFRPTATLLKNLPDGVTVMSLRRAAAEMPELVEPYLGRIAGERGSQSAPAALNTLLMQDGVFIRVADGVQLDRPLQIVNIFNADADLMSVRRVLAVVGRDASAKVLFCDHTQSAGHKYLSSQVIEIALDRDAHLDWCDIEESSELTGRHSQLYARQDAGSSLSLNSTSLIVGETRNEYDITLDGEGASLRVGGMAIADDKRKIDNSTLVTHRAGRCTSEQLFKYLLDGEGRGSFEGLIRVDEGADGTAAYQANRNMLASADARMHTAPQLEIYCDDVKCSHGATTGQLNDEALFYMRSRGIPLAEARMMLMQAFMADVIDTVPIESLRDRLRHLVERRLSGEHATCGDCSAVCKK